MTEGKRKGLIKSIKLIDWLGEREQERVEKGYGCCVLAYMCLSITLIAIDDQPVMWLASVMWEERRWKD